MSGIALRPWTSHEHLKTAEEMALYLEACLEAGDPALVTQALGVIAKACDMALPPCYVGRPSSDRH
jgi:probable addiction module antidote protein